jgi:glycosyltransferase involved in cell wall biosynthesis
MEFAVAALPVVAICFASDDMVRADFALSLAGLCNSTPPLETPIVNVKSSIIAIARNNAVARAQELGADYLLFLDSDMVFPRSTLLRLLAHGRDIVGATYLRRTPPFAILGARLAEAPLGNSPGLAEMQHLPTGCLLIRMKVFEAMTRPYFRFRHDETTGDVIGEDYDFCDRARQLGYRIWCDGALSFEIGHIGQAIYRIPKDEAP